MRKQPRISTAPIIQLPAIQQAVYPVNYVLFNGTSVVVPVTSVGTIINLATPISSLLSVTGTVSGITGTGPWTSTISGLGSTSGFTSGQTITATAGSGSIGTGTVTIASIASSTSITITSTGGSAPTAGTVSNILTSGTYFTGLTTWYLELINAQLSINNSMSVSLLVPFAGTVYNPTILVNGIAATPIGVGFAGTINRVNLYNLTIICTGLNQYSVTGFVTLL
jgi:hypothetical protein